MRVKHVVVKGGGGKLTLWCKNCDKKEEQELPLSVDALDRIGGKFIEEHAGCKLGKLKK